MGMERGEASSTGAVRPCLAARIENAITKAAAAAADPRVTSTNVARGAPEARASTKSPAAVRATMANMNLAMAFVIHLAHH